MSKRNHTRRKYRDRISTISVANKPAAARKPVAIAAAPAATERKPVAIVRKPRLPRKPVAPAGTLAARIFARLVKSLRQLVKQLIKPRRRRRKLELLEMQQLGEKRFVAVVRVGKQKFLIGGAASSVSLLAEIDSHRTTAIPPRPFDRENAA